MTAQIRIADALRTQPWHLALLPVFALAHGTNVLFGFVPLSMAVHYLLLAAAFLLASWLLAFAVARNGRKASGIAFFLGLPFLFYGPLADALRPILPAALRSFKTLPLLLAFVFLVPAGVLFATPARRRSCTFFLNSLLLLLCVVEAGTALWKSTATRPLYAGYPLSEQYKAAPAGDSRPDIYLLVMDEYAGPQPLQRLGYDNRPFLDSLRALGFWLPQHSSANYDFTPFAMSSLLQMNYIDSSRERRGNDAETVLQAVRSLSDNEVFRILRKEGYELRFEAPFDNRINPQPTLNEFGDFAYKATFGPTLPGRYWRERGRPIDPLAPLFAAEYRYDDPVKRRQDLAHYRSALAAAIDSNDSRAPRFVYQHLLITHHPYLFDAQGGPRQLLASDAEEATAYLDQLRVANRVLLEEIGQIRSRGRRNTVILLLSDHGYRRSGIRYEAFENLYALYGPRGYEGLPAEQSNVNAFRLLFNRYFGQHWPLLPDRKIAVTYE
ncbi:hypothetical protein [Flaviaesturariibacter terrae]